MEELILSGDTIGEGRVKINAAYSQDTHIWISGDTLTSIVANNSTGNKVESDFSSIVGGESNEIINDTGASNNSVIVGGASNFISGNSTSMSSAIIGGEGSKIVDNSSVFLGGTTNNSNIFGNTKTLYVEGLKTNNVRIKNVSRMTAIPSASSLSILSSTQVVDYWHNGILSSGYARININTLLSGPVRKTVEFIWNPPNPSSQTGLTLESTTAFSINGDNSSGGMGALQFVDIFYTGYSGSFTLLYSGEELSGRKTVYAFGANIFT